MFLSSSFYLAQTTFLGHKLVPTPKKAPANNFDQIVYRSQVLKKYENIVLDRSELYEFADFQVSVKKFYLNSNTEYENQDSAITFLKKICEKINPFDTPLNIKIIRDASVNACAFEDGTIYINIGLLAKYDNEAEIAAVLGHEIGHVIKQHAYKSYDIYKDIYSLKYSSPYQQKSALGTYISAKKSFKRLQEQEEESDDVSIELLKKTNYNTKALASIEEKFIAIEKKDEASIGSSGKGLFYFSTHPTSEKRLKKANTVENNNGKNFLIDSIYFQRLKRWAIDEMIYINFEEKNYLLCVEQSFNLHLIYPDDPFYLFFITEATRRSLEYYDLEGYEFISGMYKKDFGKIERGSDSVFKIIPDVGLKRIKRGNVNSILLKLNSPILSFGGEDYLRYKSAQLLNEDTLEFIDYKDALRYFSNLNRKKGFLMNNLFLDGTCGFTGLTEMENDFVQLVCDTTKLKPLANSQKLLFVLYSVNHYVREQNITVFDRSSNFKMSHNKRSSVIEALQEQDSGTHLSFGEEMDFNDRTGIINYLGTFSGLIKDKKEKTMTQSQAMKTLFNGGNIDFLITRDSASINTAKICPELVPILNKYHYAGIVFSAIEIVDETINGMYGYRGRTEKWKIFHYYFDLKRNRISFMLNPNCMSSQSSWGKSSQNDPTKCFYNTILDITR